MRHRGIPKAPTSAWRSTPFRASKTKLKSPPAIAETRDSIDYEGFYQVWPFLSPHPHCKPQTPELLGAGTPVSYSRALCFFDLRPALQIPLLPARSVPPAVHLRVPATHTGVPSRGIPFSADEFPAAGVSTARESWVLPPLACQGVSKLLSAASGSP